MWGREPSSTIQVVDLPVDHPGLKEAPSGRVGTRGNHTSLSPTG